MEQKKKNYMLSSDEFLMYEIANHASHQPW